jgi:hypothetical protein
MMHLQRQWISLKNKQWKTYSLPKRTRTIMIRAYLLLLSISIAGPQDMDEAKQPCVLQETISVAWHLQGEYAPRQNILRHMGCWR